MREGTMREIAEGVYFENAYISGNVGCILTGEGAILVDSPMLPRDAWDWLRKIASKTKQGVLPELAMTADMTSHKGHRVLRILHVGGHTPASIMVHLPQERILFAGDVVVAGEHPSLSSADTMKWLHALEVIRDMEDVEIIVPGRGEPCDPSATEILSEYISQIRERVHEYYSGGYTRRETVDKVKMEDFFGVPPDARTEIERRIRGSVERVYDEFKKGTTRRRR
jgi:cyclase